LKVAPGGTGQDHEVFFLDDDEVSRYSWGKEGGAPKIGPESYKEEGQLYDGEITAVLIKIKKYFRRLDIHMLRFLEGDSRFDVEKIKEKKQYLRSVPRTGEKFIEKYGRRSLDEKQATLVFMVFGNIFDIDIVDHGEGYVNIPNITVDPPDFGSNRARMMVEINSGSVSNIKIVNCGSGYTNIPIISIGEPPSGGRAASAKVTKVEFNLKD